MAIRRALSKKSSTSDLMKTSASRSAGAHKGAVALAIVLLEMAASVWVGPLSAQAQSPDAGSSSSQPVHHKTEANSSQTVRHTRVAEEESPPELAQAEDLIQSQHYDAAEPLLRKAVAAAPENYVAWFDLGFVENQLGRTDDSIAAYRKSVAAKPDVFETNLNLGLQLAKTGQPDAEQFLRAATQLKPTAHPAEGQERAWLSLGKVLEKSKPDEALRSYREASTLQPKDAEPHLAAGTILEKQKNYSDAEKEYKLAVAIDPSADAVTALANVSMQERQFGDAESALRKLVALRPDDAAAHMQLGRVLAAEGNNDDAISELERAAKLAPQDKACLLDLADLYETAKKFDKAEAAYRGLLAGAPNDTLKYSEIHHSLGVSLLELKKFPEAQGEFLTAVKLKPDFGAAYGDLAFAAGENKEYPLAIKALDARAKLLPETPITYFLRASAYDHLKDLKQAATNYRLFLNAAQGKYPDQEWQAKHRLIAIEPKR
jgi:tetratricopeptide (TPR) repeat protein